jgi:hypothetical protein
MSIELYFTARVENGKMINLNRDKLNTQIHYFEGKDIEIIIRKKKRSRTNQQNKAQWWYYTELGNYLGYTPEEMHEICKFKFLKRDGYNEESKEHIEYYKSTSSLTISEHSEYLDKIRIWASSLGFYLPEPNEIKNLQ